MAIPPSVRYLFARLQPAARPIVWAPILVVTLLGVVLWEYRQHPEWSDAFEIDTESPSAQIPETELTLDEQAQLSQVDSLAVLFNDLAASTPTIQAAETPEDTLFNQLSEITSQTNQAQIRPSSSYALYRTQSSAQADTSSGTASPPSLASAANLATLLNPEAASPTGQSSALQEALGRLPSQTAGTSETRSPAGQSPNSASAQTTGPSQFSNAEIPAAAQGNTPAGAAPLRYIPTTPNMSPPPGTTGYTPPATLNLAPNNYPSGNAYTNLTTPGLPQTQPRFNGLPNRSATPTLPTSPGSQYIQPQPQFNNSSSVPRPPGSYIGGGEIQTFSNPLGSSSWGPQDYPNNYNP